MARALNTRYVPFSITAPKNTPAASPVTSTFALGYVELDLVQLIVPSGHAGLTGFAIVSEGTRILPFSAATDWIIADDYTTEFVIGVEVGAHLVLQAFNTDAAYAHTFYGRFKVTDIASPGTAGNNSGAVISPLGVGGVA